MPTALITGAGSGLGRDMAQMLAKRGYDLVLVARTRTALEETAASVKTRVKIITADLSRRETCFKLYENVKNMDIRIVINNAGFGVFGDFCKAPLYRQLEMLDLNVAAVHILTHLFLNDFKKKNSGRIMNIASLAALGPGPLMSGYYAGKAYVYSLTRAIARELKEEGSKVTISAFCPGPVDTAFNSRAGVKFSIEPMPSKKAAKYALRGMFSGKEVIIPGFMCKATALGMKLLPQRLTTKLCYQIQKKKEIY